MLTRELSWDELLLLVSRFYSIQGRGWRHPALRARDQNPWVVLVACVLSARSHDESVERATRALLLAYPTARVLARARERHVRRLVREVGLVDPKARGLIAAARFLVSEFDGEVPSNEADLLRIPRVGPKTAHAILVFGHQRPGIPVDTHILRVSRRMGVVKGTTIPQAQRELARAVPKRYWHVLNPVLVQHGMNICSPHAPRCWECPIEQWCRKIGVPRRSKHAPKGSFARSIPRTRGERSARAPLAAVRPG